nr:hypothetical protein [Peribacillus simplex]
MYMSPVLVLLLKSRFNPEQMANGATRINPRNTETAVAEVSWKVSIKK